MSPGPPPVATMNPTRVGRDPGGPCAGTRRGRGRSHGCPSRRRPGRPRYRGSGPARRRCRRRAPPERSRRAPRAGPRDVADQRIERRLGTTRLVAGHQLFVRVQVGSVRVEPQLAERRQHDGTLSWDRERATSSVSSHPTNAVPRRSTPSQSTAVWRRSTPTTNARGTSRRVRNSSRDVMTGAGGGDRERHRIGPRSSSRWRATNSTTSCPASGDSRSEGARSTARRRADDAVRPTPGGGGASDCAENDDQADHGEGGDDDECKCVHGPTVTRSTRVPTSSHVVEHVAGTGPERGRLVVGVEQPAVPQRQAPAADASVELLAQPLQERDLRVEPGSPRPREPRPVLLVGRAVRGERRERFADLLQRQADLLRDRMNETGAARRGGSGVDRRRSGGRGAAPPPRRSAAPTSRRPCARSPRRSSDPPTWGRRYERGETSSKVEVSACTGFVGSGQG